MSEKKNIDKLFKEQFKDFEVAPKDYVWEHIEHELHKDKRKRRVIPIWWKVAGVAAILALLFTVGNIAVNNFGADPVEKQTVDTKTERQEGIENKQKKQSKELANPSDNNTLEDIDDTSIANQDNSSEKLNKEEQLSESQKTSNDNLVATGANDTKTQLETSSINNKRSTSTNAIVNTNTTNSKNENTKNNESLSTSQVKTASANSSDDTESKNEASEDNLTKAQSEIDKLIKDVKQSTETQVASSTASEENSNKTEIDSSSTSGIQIEENAIEKAIAEAEKEEEDSKEDEEPSKRWSVAPNVAPVYFNTLGKGSSLDNQFIENTKQGDVSMSYGLKGSYAINEKLKIRAGVNKVDLGYSTNNVLVFDDINPNTGARQMQNVNPTNSQTSSTYFSASALSISNGPEIFNAKERGSIDQQLGFIEVPLELEYSLVDNKFGLNLIGGFSTLFLNNNEVYSVENNGNRTLMGEATNIKDMSYSANFGVGVNYNVSKQLRFNLEPTFKYQINTFSNTSGDFQPFFIGVYTGLSFKF